MEHANLFGERYRYHIDLGGFGVPGQEALRDARILIAGAAGPSLTALLYLGAMGVGTIALTGPATSLKEAQLPFLSGSPEEGKGALHALARQLRELNGEVKTEIHDGSLHPGNALEAVSRYDLVIGGSAGRGTSLLLSDASLICGVPFVYGTAEKYEGTVSVFNYKAGPTLRCLPADVASKEQRESGRQSGVLGVLPGIIGGYMAAEAVKILAGIGEVLSGKLLRIDLLTHHHQLAAFTANPANRNITTLPGGYEDMEGVDPAEGARSLTPHQLALKISYQESLQLIDIREPGDVPANHLPGSISLPASQIFSRLDEIHQDLPVVLISADGETARRISGILNEKHGFGNIYYLEGGIGAWAGQGVL